MELALYSDGSDSEFPFVGYYKSEQQKSARRGDYITSVEVGPLFGAVLARALDSWWKELGSPEEFYVFDVGAGVGTLARSILRAEPACLGALKYVLVEQSKYLMSQHEDLLAQKNMRVESLHTDLSVAIPHPQVDFAIVIANELLDNLPVGLLEKTSEGWAEVGVVLESGAPNVLREELIEADSDSVELANQLASSAEVGQRVPIHRHASRWVEGALSVLKQGRVLAFDYGALTTAELCGRPQTEWLRTYRGQALGSSPYDLVCQQDITCELAVDQLNSFAAKFSVQSQADFLKQWGVEDLVAEAKAQSQSTIPTDIKDIEMHSRISEAQALLDPLGLGAHWAMQWIV